MGREDEGMAGEVEVVGQRGWAVQVRWQRARSEGGEVIRGSEEGGPQRLTAEWCQALLYRPRGDFPPHETT